MRSLALVLLAAALVSAHAHAAAVFPIPDGTYEGKGVVSLDKNTPGALRMAFLDVSGKVSSGEFFSHRELKAGVFRGYYTANIGKVKTRQPVAYGLKYVAGSSTNLIVFNPDSGKQIGTGSCAKARCTFSFKLTMLTKIAETIEYDATQKAIKIDAGIQDAGIGKLSVGFDYTASLGRK